MPGLRRNLKAGLLSPSYVKSELAHYWGIFRGECG